MPAITRLCQRAIHIDEGRVARDGKPHEVVKSYLNSGLGTTAAREWQDTDKMPGGEVARLQAVRIRTEDQQSLHRWFDIRKAVGLEMEYEVLKPDRTLLPGFHVYNEESVHVSPPSTRILPGGGGEGRQGAIGARPGSPAISSLKGPCSSMWGSRRSDRRSCNFSNGKLWRSRSSTVLMETRHAVIGPGVWRRSETALRWNTEFSRDGLPPKPVRSEVATMDGQALPKA